MPFLSPNHRRIVDISNDMMMMMIQIMKKSHANRFNDNFHVNLS